MSNKPRPPSPTYLDEPRAAESSIADLIRNLANDLSTLFGKELALAKAEFREAAAEAQKGISAIALGAGLSFAGLIFLLLAIVFGLATELPLWLSALTVGAVSLIVGYALVRSARNKVKSGSFALERTAQSVKKEAETAKRAIQ